MLKKLIVSLMIIGFFSGCVYTDSALQYAKEGTSRVQSGYDASYSEDVIEVMAVKYEKSAALKAAKELLDSTQFKFGDDYDQKDTPEWLALKVKRQEAREFIRANDVPNP